MKIISAVILLGFVCLSGCSTKTYTIRLPLHVDGLKIEVDHYSNVHNLDDARQDNVVINGNVADVRLQKILDIFARYQEGWGRFDYTAPSLVNTMHFFSMKKVVRVWGVSGCVLQERWLYVKLSVQDCEDFYALTGMPANKI